jgi:hypothetical protein
MVGNRLNKSMDIKEAFRLSLETVKDWELRSAQFSKSYFFFRSYSPSHYRQVTDQVQILHSKSINSCYTNRGCPCTWKWQQWHLEHRWLMRWPAGSTDDRHYDGLLR